MSSDIKEKIAKLLARAESPNEHEAKISLLKARKMMAEHKLQPEEIQQHNSAVVIQKTIGITCTKMTDTWANGLAAVIADHYCCKAYRTREHNAKKVTIGFVGLEDDFAVCERVFRYAYTCVQARCNEIRVDHANRGWPRRHISEMCKAYGFGFMAGLRVAFEEQDEKHQEWGLVLVTPQSVIETYNKMGKPSVYGSDSPDLWSEYRYEGFLNGKQFDPNVKNAIE